MGVSISTAEPPQSPEVVGECDCGCGGTIQREIESRSTRPREIVWNYTCTCGAIIDCALQYVLKRRV